MAVFNCECDDENPGETLGQLRRRLLIRLGYSAQADNPPPGMAQLLDDFLISSQRYLYQKYRALRTERFFTWDMEIGTRFYDLQSNSDECTKRLYPYKLSWVGVSDTNTGEQWHQLHKGINPELYNAVDRLGIPNRYEIRQCIEVFPAPDREYKLRVKGHFGLQPFAEDADQATIDSELLFLWALGLAKANYGQADAGNITQMAGDYLKQLVAGAHGTARYVPGTASAPALTRPFFTPVDGG